MRIHHRVLLVSFSPLDVLKIIFPSSIPPFFQNASHSLLLAAYEYTHLKTSLSFSLAQIRSSAPCRVPGQAFALEVLLMPPPPKLPVHCGGMLEEKKIFN